jgi:hypothetical protein
MRPPGTPEIILVAFWEMMLSMRNKAGLALDSVNAEVLPLT